MQSKLKTLYMEKIDVVLTDKSKNVDVKIKKSTDGKYWERLVSKNGIDWVVDKRLDSLDDVLQSQQEIINNNYRNLFNLIRRK